MPFTLAHPAIVVPLHQRFPRLFDLSALVVGSLSPDFEYFVRLRPVRSISHDLIDLFLLCLPTGLVAWLVFDRVMKRPLIELTPSWLRLRLRSVAAPIPLDTSPVWISAIVSLMIGACSHLLWDGFTHENGWFVERLSPLSVLLPSGPRVYKVLQHLSTFVGLILLAIWSSHWLSRQSPATGPCPRGLADKTRVVVVAIIVGSGCGFGAIIALAHAPETAHQGLYGWVVRFVIATISSSLVAALVFSLIFRSIEKRSKPTT